MTNPNSRWSKLRFILAERLEPGPDPGEAWCRECSLTNGHTLILPADGIEPHARLHEEKGPEFSYMRIAAAWPRRQPACYRSNMGVMIHGPGCKHE